MANPEESNPLLKHPDGREEAARGSQLNAPPTAPPVDAPTPQEEAPLPPRPPKEPAPEPPVNSKAPPQAAPKQLEKAPPVAAKGQTPWAADGLPVAFSVVGEPVGRTRWSSSTFACLGRNDEFCSSDLEVCVLGLCLPCALYGSNVERLGGVPGSFADHCLPYTALFMLGNALFGWNSLAPWFSHFTRTAIRRRFNLEGTFEAFTRNTDCCKGLVEDEAKRERLEILCDLATHYMCHTCSLCQEARELRRRLPHPGLNMQPVLVMMPPMEQTMGRGA